MGEQPWSAEALAPRAALGELLSELGRLLLGVLSAFISGSSHVRGILRGFRRSGRCDGPGPRSDRRSRSSVEEHAGAYFAISIEIGFHNCFELWDGCSCRRGVE